MPRPLGSIQREMLRCLEEHGGVWHWGCGWYWKNQTHDERVMLSLLRRGLVTRHRPRPSGQRLTVQITPAGREALVAPSS
jgi:hypothetical protein